MRSRRHHGIGKGEVIAFIAILVPARWRTCT